MQEFVLIDSRAVHVEVFRRGDHNRWFFQEYDADDEVVFESIGLSIPIEALYEDLTLTRRERIVVE